MGKLVIIDGVLKKCIEVDAKTVIPAEVVEIAPYAFAGQGSLKEVYFEENGRNGQGGLKKIGLSAFMGCPNLRKIELPPTLQEIGNSAFCDCDYLKSIEIPRSVRKIDSFAFSGCKSLRQVIFAPGSALSEILSRAFSDCVQLRSISIPTHFNFLAGGIFHGCTRLKHIAIEDPILPQKSIDDLPYQDETCTHEIVRGAFWNCPNLKTITVPLFMAKGSEGWLPEGCTLAFQ